MAVPTIIGCLLAVPVSNESFLVGSQCRKHDSTTDGVLQDFLVSVCLNALVAEGFSLAPFVACDFLVEKLIFFSLLWKSRTHVSSGVRVASRAFVTLGVTKIGFGVIH